MSEVRDLQLKVLWLSGRLYHRHEIVEPHQHDFAQVQLVLSGQEYTDLTQSNGTDPLSVSVFANQLVFIPPYTTHSFHFEHETVVLDVKFDLQADIAGLIEKNASQRIFDVEDVSPFYALLNEAIPAEQKRFPAAALQLDVDFKQLLLSTIFKQQPAESSTHDLDRLIDINTDFPLLKYLQDHYAEPIQLPELAAHFNYSKNYLIRICKRETGLTPMNLLQHIRLKHAQNYLEYTDLSVNDIAIKIGLDANYLTKSFTKTIGTHPIAYRKQSRQEHERNITLMNTFNRQSQPQIKNTIQHPMD